MRSVQQLLNAAQGTQGLTPQQILNSLLERGLNQVAVAYPGDDLQAIVTAAAAGDGVTSDNPAIVLDYTDDTYTQDAAVIVHRMQTPSNMYTVGPRGCDYTDVQAAVDAAVAAGASLADHWEIKTFDGADLTCNIDPVTLRPLTTASAAADGVFVDCWDDFLGLTTVPPPVLQEPLLALRLDDTRRHWIRLAAGTIVFSPTSAASPWTADCISDPTHDIFYLQAISTASYPSYFDLEDYPPDMVSAAKWHQRVKIPTAFTTGMVMHHDSLTAVDLTGINYLSLRISGAVGAIPAGALEFGICDNATFSEVAAAWYPLPGIAYNEKIVHLVDISASGLVDNIESVGLRVAADVSTGADVYFHIGDIRVATHPFIGVSPLRYALRNGVPITHAIITDVISTAINGPGIDTDIMSYENLHRAAIYYGNELGQHAAALNGQADPLAAFREKQIGCKYQLEALDLTSMSSTRYSPVKPGIPVDVHIESGDVNNSDYALGYSELNGNYARLLRKHYKCSTANASTVGESGRAKYFSEASYNDTTLATLIARLAVADGIGNSTVMLHYITEAGTGSSTISYTEWKQLIDAIAAAHVAGRCTPVTLSTFFGADTVPYGSLASTWLSGKDSNLDALTAGALSTSSGASWYKDSGSAGTAVVTADIGPLGAGHNGIRVAGTTGLTDVAIPQINLPPGRYAIRIAVKTSDLSARCALHYKWADRDGTYNADAGYACDNVQLAAADTWQYVYATITVPLQCKLFQIWIRVTRNDTTNFDIGGWHYRPI